MLIYIAKYGINIANINTWHIWIEIARRRVPHVRSMQANSRHTIQGDVPTVDNTYTLSTVSVTLDRRTLSRIYALIYKH